MDRLKRVVVGIDFSPRSMAAAEIGRDLAKSCRAELLLVHCIENAPDEEVADSVGRPYEQLMDGVREEAQSRLESAAGSLGYEKTAAKTAFGAASDALMDSCEDSASTLLIVGDIGQAEGSGEKLLGSTARRLLSALQCRVLIARPLKRKVIKRIAAAVDTQTDYSEILEQARRLAAAMGASVDVVSVLPTGFAAGLERIMRQDQIDDAVAHSVKESAARLKAAVGEIDWRDIRVRVRVVPGSVATRLIDFARSHATDVMVIGAAPLPDLVRYFVGSTAQQVIEHTYCSVLVVKT